jgi:hypothetical protein
LLLGGHGAFQSELFLNQQRLQLGALARGELGVGHVGFLLGRSMFRRLGGEKLAARQDKLVAERPVKPGWSCEGSMVERVALRQQVDPRILSVHALDGLRASPRLVSVMLLRPLCK